MRASTRTELTQLAIIAGMFIAAFLTLPVAPETVAVRWNANGQPVGYASPAFALLLPPVLALVIYLVLRYVPLIDPGRANYSNFAGTYAFIRWITLLFLAGMYAIIHLALRGVAIDVGVIAPLAVGVLFIGLGNVMGKLRPNWFVGIRTPWTLSSKRAWTRTHAVGGRVFIVIGIAFALVPFARAVGLGASAVLAAAVAVAMLGVVYLFVYSYLVWRDDPDRIPPAGTLPADLS
jgi:uncharacterized membrane protein